MYGSKTHTFSPLYFYWRWQFSWKCQWLISWCKLLALYNSNTKISTLSITADFNRLWLMVIPNFSNDSKINGEDWTSEAFFLIFSGSYTKLIYTRFCFMMLFTFQSNFLSTAPYFQKKNWSRGILMQVTFSYGRSFNVDLMQKKMAKNNLESIR